MFLQERQIEQSASGGVCPSHAKKFSLVISPKTVFTRNRVLRRVLCQHIHQNSPVQNRQKDDFAYAIFYVYFTLKVSAPTIKIQSFGMHAHVCGLLAGFGWERCGD